MSTSPVASTVQHSILQQLYTCTSTVKEVITETDRGSDVRASNNVWSASNERTEFIRNLQAYLAHIAPRRLVYTGSRVLPSIALAGGGQNVVLVVKTRFSPYWARDNLLVVLSFSTSKP